MSIPQSALLVAEPAPTTNGSQPGAEQIDGLAPTTNGSQPVAEQPEPSREGIVPNIKRGVYTQKFPVLEREYFARTSTIPSNKQIIESKIIARATVRVPGADHVTIIAAFQLSHERYFWFVFKAKTARSPRKNWRQIRSLAARTTFPTVTIITLDTVIKSITNGTDSAMITRRYTVGKRNLTDHLKRISTPQYHRPQPDTPIRTDLVNRRNGWKPMRTRPGILG